LGGLQREGYPMKSNYCIYSKYLVTLLLSLLFFAACFHIISIEQSFADASSLDVKPADTCIPLTGVDVTGPPEGIVGVQYTFPVSITPANATPPFTYVVVIAVQVVISPTEQPASNSTPYFSEMPVYTMIHPIRYTWNYSGDFGVGIEHAYNACGGPVDDFHDIHITSKRFTFNVTPPYQQIPFGGTAVYNLETEAYAGFTETVVLTTSDIFPDLSFELTATEILPGNSARLTVTHHNTDTVVLPGLWHTIPITASGGNITWVRSVSLLIGGDRIYLPMLIKSSQ